MGKTQALYFSTHNHSDRSQHNFANCCHFLSLHQQSVTGCSSQDSFACLKDLGKKQQNHQGLDIFSKYENFKCYQKAIQISNYICQNYSQEIKVLNWTITVIPVWLILLPVLREHSNYIKFSNKHSKLFESRTFFFQPVHIEDYIEISNKTTANYQQTGCCKWRPSSSADMGIKTVD